MNNKDYYIRIPRQKQAFYKLLEFPKDINKDIRILIKVINHLQKLSKSPQKKQ